METIIEDQREIGGVYFDDEEGSRFQVGENGVTSIKAYGENAEYCLVPWLAIYRGEEIWQRLPAGRVRIYYKSAD